MAHCHRKWLQTRSEEIVLCHTETPETAKDRCCLYSNNNSNNSNNLVRNNTFCYICILNVGRAWTMKDRLIPMIWSALLLKLTCVVGISCVLVLSRGTASNHTSNWDMQKTWYKMYNGGISQLSLILLALSTLRACYGSLKIRYFTPANRTISLHIPQKQRKLHSITTVLSSFVLTIATYVAILFLPSSLGLPPQGIDGCNLSSAMCNITPLKQKGNRQSRVFPARTHGNRL